MLEWRTEWRPLAAALLALAAVARPGAAAASSKRDCAPTGTYGSQCVKVWGSGRQVTQIETWFTGFPDMLDHEKWRVDLERYACNPVRRAKVECPAAATWHGKIQVRRSTDARGRVQFGQSRTGRYWPTFPTLPHTFRSNVWLCTELAFYNSSAGKWVYNAAGLVRGLRACISVHA